MEQSKDQLGDRSLLNTTEIDSTLALLRLVKHHQGTNGIARLQSAMAGFCVYGTWPETYTPKEAEEKS
jgi:hypothetical protein